MYLPTVREVETGASGTWFVCTLYVWVMVAGLWGWLSTLKTLAEMIR